MTTNRTTDVSRQLFDSLLNLLGEQRTALELEDIQRYLELAAERDNLMELISISNITVASDNAAKVSGNDAGPFDDQFDLFAVLHEVVDLDKGNGEIIARLLSKTRSELDNVRRGRTVLHAYGHSLSQYQQFFYDEKA